MKRYIGNNRNFYRHFGIAFSIVFTALILQFQPVRAVSVNTPWTTENGLQNLVYGSSTPGDVHAILGAPNDIQHYEQMYPVLEEDYYYSEDKSGAASVFVFENNVLVGFYYKSPNNQVIDLSYFLPNNNDRSLTTPYLGQYSTFSPQYPFYSMY
jgi:hypothetical protein